MKFLQAESLHFASWICDFATWFTTWKWFRTLVRSLEMISHLGSQLQKWNFNLRNGTRVLAGGFTATKHLAKFSQVILQLISQLQNGFWSAKFSQLISQLILQLRNFRSTLCGCLQKAITSYFQLQFAHRLKCWTPDFPSFEMKYSMHKMDSIKYLKCV